MAAGITSSDERPGPVSGGEPGPRDGEPPRAPRYRKGTHGGNTGDGDPSLRFGVTVTMGTATVVLHGELDPVTMPLLALRLAQVLADRPQRLVLDMAGVTYIDCASARLIAGAGRHLPAGVRPAVRSPSLVTRRVLALTGLADHVDTHAPGVELPAL